MSTPESWLRAADPRRRVGHAVEYHSALGSTNDRARELLRTPGGEGTAVVANVQTAGRGRRGRSWLSPAGLNLTFSVSLRPRLDAEHGWWLAAAASLAARRACEPVAQLLLRWPNDVVAGDGRKVAGMLLETSVDRDAVSEAVIGIGINVNWRRSAMPAELAAGATSLADVAGTEVDRVALLSRLLAALDDEVAALEERRSPLDRYRAASWLDGRAVRVELGGEVIDGRALGIGADGALLVETVDGPRSVTHGEVVRVHPEADRHEAVPA